MAEAWFSTPDGPMRRFEEARSKTAAHWYVDRDQHWRVFADRDTKPTRAPLWWRQITNGERLLAARKEARR